MRPGTWPESLSSRANYALSMDQAVYTRNGQWNKGEIDEGFIVSCYSIMLFFESVFCRII